MSDTKPDLDVIEARANAATPGPWHWRNSSHSVHLFGERHRVVMGFERMGMQGAQPTFRDDRNILHPAGKLNINEFPDAAFIARARDDIPALVAYARTLEAENERLQVREQHALEYERCITWDTTCSGCADRLNEAYQDHMRAEAAEAERDQLRDTLALRSAAHNRLAQRLDQIRELVDEWGELGQDVPTRDLRRVLDGDQRKEAP